VTAEYPPLHPAVIAAADLVGVESVTGQRIWLAAVGTGTVVLVGLLGRRVGGHAVGLVAAGLAAGYPMLFLSDATLMPETVFALLVTLLLLLALRVVDEPASAGRVAVLGAVVGLATLARSEALLFLPLLVVPLLWRRWRLVALGVAAAAAVILPWSVRNYVRFDAVVPVSNNLGSALDGANCERAYEGSQRGLWLFDCFGGFDLREQDETEAAAFHRDRGLRYAREHASRLPVVGAVRWARTFGVYDVRQQTFFESFEGRPFRWQEWGTRMWWVLAPLAVAGGWLLGRRGRRRELWVLASTVVVVSITTVLTYGNQRFRIAAEPAVLVLAALALVAGAGRIAGRRPVPAPGIDSGVSVPGARSTSV
jgi:4-amino-4-deoxy-L-arabinose transferase-like glycosyltransferase